MTELVQAARRVFDDNVKAFGEEYDTFIICPNGDSEVEVLFAVHGYGGEVSADVSGGGEISNDPESAYYDQNAWKLVEDLRKALADCDTGSYPTLNQSVIVLDNTVYDHDDYLEYTYLRVNETKNGTYISDDEQEWGKPNAIFLGKYPPTWLCCDGTFDVRVPRYEFDGDNLPYDAADDPREYEDLEPEDYED